MKNKSPTENEIKIVKFVVIENDKVGFGFLTDYPLKIRYCRQLLQKIMKTPDLQPMSSHG